MLGKLHEKKGCCGGEAGGRLRHRKAANGCCGG
jgi:hypothetical protein